MSMTLESEWEAVSANDSCVFPRVGDADYPLVERGEGVWLTMAGDGKRLLDACSGGAMTACLGYGDRHVIGAAATQGNTLSYIYGHHFTNEPQERLAARLVTEVAPQMARVRFVSGGSEANETALRLARSYHVERGDHQRWRIISPAQAYHGSLIGTLALSGRPSLRERWAPYLATSLHLSSSWRDDPTGERALSELDRLLIESGPGTVSAYMCEPVSAAAAPAMHPPDEFWRGLDERRREHGFLVIFDEIVTGMGRTGGWLASQRLPIAPDITTIGKGLDAGYAPLAGVLCTQGVFDALDGGSGDFEHGHTWDGAPLPCAVGNAVLDRLEAVDAPSRAQAAGAQMLSALGEALADLPLVREVRGSGLLLGIELADPRDGLSPLPGGLDIERLVMQEAFEGGIVVAATATATDGIVGDQVILAPAFTASDDELAEMVDRTALVLSSLRNRVESAIARQGAGAPSTFDSLH